MTSENQPETNDAEARPRKQARAGAYTYKCNVDPKVRERDGPAAATLGGRTDEVQALRRCDRETRKRTRNPTTDTSFFACLFFTNLETDRFCQDRLRSKGKETRQERTALAWIDVIPSRNDHRIC